MTRSPGKIDDLRSAGAQPVLCDIYDRASLVTAVEAFRPDVVMHQLTDLPDDLGKLAEFLPRNERIRTEGTQNLIAAASAAAAPHLIAQSIAWPGGPAGEAHEKAILAANGTVLRYGQFYGPGTFYEGDPPALRLNSAGQRARGRRNLTAIRLAR